MFCCKDVLCWRMDQPFWFVAAVRLAMSEHTKPKFGIPSARLWLLFSYLITFRGSLHNTLFTWKDAAKAFVGLHHWTSTSLHITARRQQQWLQWRVQVGCQESGRYGSNMENSWKLWRTERSEFIQYPELSIRIGSYLNYMGINMGKTSKFPDESTATTPQEAPWNWKSFWRRCWKCCVNMSCWLMSSGVIVILNIIYCVCHTYYIYVLWCNMYVILGSIINPSALLAFYDDISLYSM